MQLAPNDYLTLKDKAVVLLAQGKVDEATALTRHLIELRPHDTYRSYQLGVLLMMQGHHAEALDRFMTARSGLATNLDDPNYIDANIAAALLANGRLSEAIGRAHLAISEFSPGSGRSAEMPWLALIAAESANGQEAEARADLTRFLIIHRTWGTMAEVEKEPAFAANPKLLDGLRGAGMPQQ